MYKILALLLVFSYNLNAQTVKSPQAYFGYGFGERFHFHSQLVEYAKYISQNNPKNTKFISTGKTTEGREMLVVAFGSEKNIQNLEKIRLANLQSIGMAEGSTDESLPAIAMLSYNVHGNEAVNSEVAFEVLYELGKGNSAFANKMFEKMVILIDPCVNPDGFDRYTQWYNRQLGSKPNANPDAAEHQEPWPGGRFNHYYYDMNRDLAWQTQVETQQRMRFYNSWLPHYHGDFHEMGPNSTTYFAPSAKPFHEDLSDYQRSFQNLIGNYHKKEFDKKGWLYFTGNSYDLLYPSYGDTYPSYNGAVAMTYEQAGSGRAGLAYQRLDGDTLTLAGRMLRTYNSSLAAMEAVYDNSDEIKEQFQAYFNKPKKEGYGKYKSYIMKGKEGNITALTQLLNNLGINYTFANKETQMNGFAYKSQKNETFKISENDLIVNTYQPKGVFTKILFEPHTMLEDSNTYDIVAWALPYAYGLEAYGVAQKVEGATQPKISEKNELSKTGNLYAYILQLKSFEDYKFMAAALQENIPFRIQPKAFQATGKSYPAGTLILTKQGNKNFESQINSLLKIHPATLETMASGMVEKGFDLGMEEVEMVAPPKVGIMMGSGVSPTAFGDVWHFLDKKMNYPATLLDINSFNFSRLPNYDVLIFPSGRYEKSTVESKELQNWIKSGGRLILLESACDAFAGVDGYDLKEKPKPEAAKADLSKKYGEAMRESISESIPGSIFEINLDNTHPLAFGYGNTMNILIKSPNRYEYLAEGWNVGVLGEFKSGFVGTKLQKTLKDVPVFAVQDKGRGKVIYLTESPIFRGFWYTGKSLFANAIFFVK